jgi:hypothetical protein
VEAYLHTPLVVEVNHGVDPLVGWKSWFELFTKSIRDLMGSVFWKAITVKLYALVPYSMADERTMLAITLLNTVQQNRQLVPTSVAMAQIRAYYMGARPQRVSVVNTNVKKKMVLTMKPLDQPSI